VAGEGFGDGNGQEWGQVRSTVKRKSKKLKPFGRATRTKRVRRRGEQTFAGLFSKSNRPGGRTEKCVSKKEMQHEETRGGGSTKTGRKQWRETEGIRKRQKSEKGVLMISPPKDSKSKHYSVRNTRASSSDGNAPPAKKGGPLDHVILRKRGHERKKGGVGVS